MGGTRVTAAGRLRAVRLGFDSHMGFLATFRLRLFRVGRVVVAAARAGEAEARDLAQVG